MDENLPPKIVRDAPGPPPPVTLSQAVGLADAPRILGRLSKVRILLAFGVAVISDLLSLGADFLPPLQWIIDLTTALLLFAILGWRWLILPGLIAEAIPGIGLFPVWVLVVASITAWGSFRRDPPRQGTGALPP